MKLVDYHDVKNNNINNRISLHSLYSEESRVRKELEEINNVVEQKQKLCDSLNDLCILRREEIKDLENKLDLIYDQMESCYKDYLKFWEYNKQNDDY